MGQQPIAYLLHGFLGCGKTTFAKQLEQECCAVRFTHDEWMSALYGDDPPAEQFQHYAARVSAVMEAMWTRLLDLGTSVVLDFGLWSRSERKRITLLTERHGGRPVLYHLRCSYETAWQRVEERNKDLRGSLHISCNTFEVLKTRFEPLAPDEAFLSIEAE